MYPHLKRWMKLGQKRDRRNLQRLMEPLFSSSSEVLFKGLQNFRIVDICK